MKFISILPEKGFWNLYNRFKIIGIMNVECQIPGVYVIDSINGKKHGFGELQFEGCFSDLVYSSQWINGSPSHKGFLYNRRTSCILGVIFSENEFHLFSTDDSPAYDVLDKDNGERWEGMSYQGSPCGFGEYYDQFSRLVYRGMCMDYEWEGHGTLFYPDLGVSVMDREGWWCHGVLRQGSVYDRRGSLVVSGVFCNGVCMPSQSLYLQGRIGLDDTHCYVEELTIGDNSLNEVTEMNLDLFRRLRVFTVGRFSLQHCNYLYIAHLHHLQQITVGCDSFSELGRDLSLLLSEMNSTINLKKCCRIIDLPVLSSLSFDCGSFSDYSCLTISNTPSLKRMSLGKVGHISCSFFFSTSLSLSSTNSNCFIFMI